MLIEEIILTGAAGSIGSIVSRSLYESGIKIHGVDIRPFDGNDNFFQSFSECDLTDEGSVETTFSKIFSQNKNIDGLVSLAGYISSGLLINPIKKGSERALPLKDFQKTIDLNLTTTFLSGRAFADKMIAHKRKGVVVNTSSVSAGGNLGQTAYAASKAAVEAMTKVWSQELAMFGIRANCISPGFFDTPSTNEALTESELTKIKQRIPSRKLGGEESLVSAIQFCLSNAYFNGRTLNIDGGIRL